MEPLQEPLLPDPPELPAPTASAPSEPRSGPPQQIAAATQTEPGSPMPQALGQVPRDALGRLVLGLLHTMLPGRINDLHTPRAAGLIWQLRQRVSLALACTVLTAPICVWLLIRAVTTYMSAQGCIGPLRVWLLGFLMLQLAWPICMPSLTLLLLGWCLGALLLLQEQRRCKQIHEFLLQASALQVLQAVLLLVAAAAVLTARPLVQRLSDLLSRSGTDPQVVADISVVPAADVPADQECVICLSREEEDGVPWRQLACGHCFHEPCLLEWLGKARKCPVCRLDLHQAHRRIAAGDTPRRSSQGDPEL